LKYESLDIRGPDDNVIVAVGEVAVYENAKVRQAILVGARASNITEPPIVMPKLVFV
jgi:hypothetical protein